MQMQEPTLPTILTFPSSISIATPGVSGDTEGLGPPPYRHNHYSFDSEEKNTCPMAHYGNRVYHNRTVAHDPSFVQNRSSAFVNDPVDDSVERFRHVRGETLNRIDSDLDKTVARYERYVDSLTSSSQRLGVSSHVPKNFPYRWGEYVNDDVSFEKTMVFYNLGVLHVKRAHHNLSNARCVAKRKRDTETNRDVDGAYLVDVIEALRTASGTFEEMERCVPKKGHWNNNVVREGRSDDGDRGSLSPNAIREVRPPFESKASTAVNWNDFSLALAQTCVYEKAKRLKGYRDVKTKQMHLARIAEYTASIWRRVDPKELPELNKRYLYFIKACFKVLPKLHWGLYLRRYCIDEKEGASSSNRDGEDHVHDDKSRSKTVSCLEYATVTLKNLLDRYEEREGIGGIKDRVLNTMERGRITIKFKDDAEFLEGATRGDPITPFDERIEFKSHPAFSVVERLYEYCNYHYSNCKKENDEIYHEYPIPRINSFIGKELKPLDDERFVVKTKRYEASSLSSVDSEEIEATSAVSTTRRGLVVESCTADENKEHRKEENLYEIYNTFEIGDYLEIIQKYISMFSNVVEDPILERLKGDGKINFGADARRTYDAVKRKNDYLRWKMEEFRKRLKEKAKAMESTSATLTKEMQSNFTIETIRLQLSVDDATRFYFELKAFLKDRFIIKNYLV